MNETLIVSSVGLWLVVSLNLVLTLALVRRINKQALPAGNGAGAGLSGLSKGTAAPDFAATTLSGEPVSLASYAGRTVAFLFISPGCSPCRDGLPRYLSWHRQALPLGIDMVLVSAADAQETQPLVDEFSIDMPILLAPRGTSTFLADYKVPGTPHYTLLNSQGVVISSDYPGYDWHSWSGAVQATSTPPATLVASEA
jgi:peroxiredoxin